MLFRSHATPHGPVDVSALGADFYAVSTYKLFGPHLGAVVARPELLDRLHPAKLVPAPDEGPERFERGTPPFELLAGVVVLIDWLAALADVSGDRRARVTSAMRALEQYLETLLTRALDGLSAIPGVRLLGAAAHRTPTISFVIEGQEPSEIARQLGERGISVWHGDNYARELMRRFGLADSGGAVRASIVLYNDQSDIDRLVDAVGALARP